MHIRICEADNITQSLIGYTIEKSSDPKITRAFLNNVWDYHTANDLPATLFALGKSVEANKDDLKRFAQNKLFDFSQHTYSHIAFKDISETRNDGRKCFLKGADLRTIEREVAKTNQMIFSLYGKDCQGVEGARGYHLGLADRPDVVETLINNGFKYCVTYCRNEQGWNPVDIDVQPYWYELKSKARLLEIPNQGWQDAAYIKEYGEGSVTDYYSFCLRLVKEAKKKNLSVSFIMHDWTNAQWDKTFGHTASLYDSIRALNIPMRNFIDYYNIQQQAIA